MPTVLQAIAESNTLSGLLARMDQSKHCLQLVLTRLPLGLHTSLEAGPLSEGIWCLLVRNASAVAKLKQLEPLMLSVLQAAQLPVTSIRIKRQY
jgi:hypothetical protein